MFLIFVFLIKKSVYWNKNWIWAFYSWNEQKHIFTHISGHFLQNLKNENFDGRLLITQSNGGSLSASEARLKPVTLAVSGPAGVIVSSSYLGKTIN